MYWIPYAFVRITIFFIFGILSGVYFFDDAESSHALYLSVISLLVFIVITLNFKKRNFLKFNLLISFTTFLSVYSMGLLHVLVSQEDQNPEHIVNEENVEAYIGILNTPGVEKAKTFRYDIEVSDVKTEEGWASSEGIIILYIDKNVDLPDYGDQILINKSPQEIAKPSNPHQFDYKTYINRQGIYHQQYLRQNDFVVTSKGDVAFLASTIFDVRTWAVAVFDQYIDNQKERSIVQALILGYKETLDTEVQKAYAASGTLHILAVSGLHVGIIYGLLYFLLAHLRQGNRTKWLFAGIALIVLWSYAAITGFSPSVSRAVTMFSFIVVAKASGRMTNIYNTLAAAAFVLLLYDPYLILSVGFQLSFLAVLGIVYLQPKIYQWILFENYFLEKGWSITSVAIAVQLATFPLGLYYFHQFPTYFFLSNLVAIPAALLILILGITLLATSVLPFLPDLVGYVLEYVVFILNYIMLKMQSLPLNKIDGVSIDAFQTILLYGFTWSLLLMFALKSYRFIYSALVGAIMFALVSWKALDDNQNIHQLIIYDVNNHTAIEFIENRQSYIYGDSIVQPGTDAFIFNVYPNHLEKGIKQVSFQNISESTGLKYWEGAKMLVFKERKVLLIDKEAPPRLFLKAKMNIDDIVLLGSADVEFNWIKANFNFQNIILDHSLEFWHYRSLKKQLEEQNITYHSVRDHGAFVIDL